LKDEVELEWKPRVKVLKGKVNKLGKNVSVLQDAKEENSVMKRKLEKSTAEKEKMDRDNYELRVRVKELPDKLTMWSKDSKKMKRDLNLAEKRL